MDHLYLLPDEQLINEVESAGLDGNRYGAYFLSYNVISVLTNS